MANQKRVTIKVPCSRNIQWADIGDRLFLSRGVINLIGPSRLPWCRPTQVSEGQIVSIVTMENRFCYYKVKKGAQSKLGKAKLANLQQIACYKGFPGRRKYQRLVNSVCPPVSPCKLVRSRWSRTAKALVDTLRTGKEHGFSICQGKDGNPYVYQYCQGDQCSVSIEPCKQPVKTLGVVHTHPKASHEEFWKSGYIGLSAGDVIVAAYHKGFICAVDTTHGLGECLITSPQADIKGLLQMAPNSPVRLGTKLSEKTILARCKLDLSEAGKEEVWFQCKTDTS